MPRIPRLVVEGEEAVYHVMSRTALDGLVMEDLEKEYLLGLMKWLSKVFFVKVYGFCIMGNHFHMLIKVMPGERFSDEEVAERIRRYYGDEEDAKRDIEKYRMKFSRLSEFIKEIKQRFSRYYNKRHDRKGYFWGERFKSVLIEEGAALLNCLAYIDLNPVRAGIVKRPEDYRWCGIAYHIGTGNRGGFLSNCLGVEEYCKEGSTYNERLRRYREYLYEKGGMELDGKGHIDEETIEREGGSGFKLPRREIFTKRIRYFTDSGILGTRSFVKEWYGHFKDYFTSKEKMPKRVPGVHGVYSLKRLAI